MSTSRRTSLLMAGVLAIVLVLSAGTSSAQTPGGDNPLGKESRIVDAQWYASNYGIDLNEALRQLQIQDDIDDLEPALLKQEKDTFAGLWIQHTPQFRIVVAFTHDGEKTIQPYIANKPWANVLEVRTADATLTELETAQDASHRMLREWNIPGESFIDIIKNRVELHVTDQVRPDLDAALQKENLQLPPHVIVVTVKNLFHPTADIFGGKRLNGPNGADCTSGFSVKHTDGTKGVTTAGHCPDTNVTYNGVNLPLRSATYGGPWDIQWHQASQAFTVRNLIFDGTYNRYIYSTKSRDNQQVGESVCKYGWAGGGGCGTIYSKYVLPVGQPNGTATFIWVKNVVTIGGDSGGPVFWNNTAYGTVTATSDGNDFIYMGVNYISSGLSGVTVLTN